MRLERSQKSKQVGKDRQELEKVNAFYILMLKALLPQSRQRPWWNCPPLSRIVLILIINQNIIKRWLAIVEIKIMRMILR